MDEYFKIGKLVATFGISGQLVLQHSLGKKNALKDLNTFFLEEKKESFLPYFVKSVKAKTDNEIFISLEGIDTKENAQKLLRKEVWLNDSDFKKFAATTAPVSLLGYSIVAGKEELGEVTEVIEQPHQVLCAIYINGKEALIPVHEDSLVKMDKKNRKLYVNLPDGLLDLYKGE